MAELNPNLSVIKSRQDGVTVLTNGIDATVAISVVDLSKSDTDMSFETNTNDVRNTPRVWLSSSTEVTVSMGNNTGTTTVSWEVIEYV